MICSGSTCRISSKGVLGRSACTIPTIRNTAQRVALLRLTDLETEERVRQGRSKHSMSSGAACHSSRPK